MKTTKGENTMGQNKCTSKTGQLQEWAPGQSLKLRFNEILLDTLQYHFKLKKKELPPDIEHKRIEQDDGFIEQKSRLYAFEKVESVRIVSFNAVGAVYVRNTSIWPTEDYDFPVLIYDSGEPKRYLFMLLDFHPLHQDEEYLRHYIEPLSQIKEKHKDIPIAERARTDLREWIKQYSSGYPFYIRCPKEYEDRIELGFQEYLNFYVEKIKEARPIEDANLRAEVLEFKKKLKKVYVENDPGGGPLRMFFGNEWVERYLNKFLFI